MLERENVVSCACCDHVLCCRCLFPRCHVLTAACVCACPFGQCAAVVRADNCVTLLRDGGSAGSGPVMPQCISQYRVDVGRGNTDVKLDALVEVVAGLREAVHGGQVCDCLFVLLLYSFTLQQ